MFNEYNDFFTKITEEASKNNTKNILGHSHFFNNISQLLA